MYADWKRKTKVEILNNTSKKCNFVLQQFHILRSFMSAPRFRATWGMSLAMKHIWKNCISIASKISQTIKKKSNAFVPTRSYFFAAACFTGPCMLSGFLKWAPHFCIHSLFLLHHEDKVWKDEFHQFFHSIAQEFSVKIESSKNHVPYLRPI